MTPCATGTFANASGQAVCIKCDRGKFQNLTRQTVCMICEPGSYCQIQSVIQGASTPTLCKAGSYSSSTNLSSADHCSKCPLGSYCEAGATKPTPCPEGKEGTDVRLTSEAACTKCTAAFTSMPGEGCTYCKHDFYYDHRDTQCKDCFKGTDCSEETITPNGIAILSHGPKSLAEVRIKANYWRLGENSTTLSQCLTTADGSGPCVGGNRSGDEDEYKPGYTGNGYCKKGHTGPLCQVCTTSDFYFDEEETMECVQCPSPLDRLYFPIGCICVLAALLIAAFAIKKYTSPPASPVLSVHPCTITCISVPFTSAAIPNR